MRFYQYKWRYPDYHQYISIPQINKAWPQDYFMNQDVISLVTPKDRRCNHPETNR